MIRLWLIMTLSVSLSTAAPHHVVKEATAVDLVAGDIASVDNVDGDNLDSDGLHSHTNREARLSFQGGAVTFSGTISSDGDHNIITNNIASIISNYASPKPPHGQNSEAIDGGWTSFGACTKTCEGGLQTRTCTNPPPENSGQHCIGDASQSCNEGVECPPDKLYIGEKLSAGEFLRSDNEKYDFVVQNDGNMVVYQNQKQNDGNMVVYQNQNEKVLWNSDTKTPGSVLMFQEDGNLVLIKDDIAVWSPGTFMASALELVMKDDGILVLYNKAGKILWASNQGEVIKEIQKLRTLIHTMKNAANEFAVDEQNEMKYGEMALLNIIDEAKAYLEDCTSDCQSTKLNITYNTIIYKLIDLFWLYSSNIDQVPTVPTVSSEILEELEKITNTFDEEADKVLEIFDPTTQFTVCNSELKIDCSCGAGKCEEGQVCAHGECLNVCDFNSNDPVTADCFCIVRERGKLCPKALKEDDTKLCSTILGCVGPKALQCSTINGGNCDVDKGHHFPFFFLFG